MPAAIHHYVQRAFRRPTARFPLEGAVVCEEDRVCAAFALECRDGHVAAVAYRSSSCATLLALCEYLAKTLPPAKGRPEAVTVGMREFRIVARILSIVSRERITAEMAKDRYERRTGGKARK